MSDNLYWDKIPQPTSAWMPSQEMHRFHLKMLVVRAGLLVVIATGVFSLFMEAGRYPSVLIRPHDGGLAYTQPTPSLPNREAMTKAFGEVIAAAFFRTEKGAVPGLKDYVREGIFTSLPTGSDFHLKDKSYSAGYVQSFRITSVKIVKAEASIVGVVATGVFISRNADRSQSDNLTIAAAFEPVPRTEKNPLGWEMSRLTRSADQ
jgi:hypothetical protein